MKTDEEKRHHADEALDRLCAMTIEGMEALVENKSLTERIHQLALDNQRLRFEAITERNLKIDAYNRNHAQHLEIERLSNLLAGRIDRGPVDPSLLLRSVLDVIHAAAESNGPDDDQPDGGGEGEAINQ